MLSPRRDDGFTLVELLVSVSILTVLLGAVSGSLYVALRTAASADQRLGESADELTATTYFGDDVHGARSVSVGRTPRCGTDPAAVVEFVGLDFTDDASFIPITTAVSYVLRTVTAAGGTTTRELHRLACTAPTTAPTYPLVPATDVTVVRRLSSGAPTVSCGSPGCAAFAQVSVTLRAESGNLTYTLTGRRRTTA